MINPNQLLTDLQAQCRKLETDLRRQVDENTELNERLQADYQAARKAERTAATFNTWLDNEITQSAVAWILACAFVRFAEDNSLIRSPLLAGPGDNLRRARDAAREYFRSAPTDHDRHYLHHCFGQMAELPAVAGLFDRDHNPLFRFPPSPEGARDLLTFWQQVDPDSGELRHDFTDPELDTRFLGDLYQDLSEAARKRYALLQTPVFVEEFILDRTLEPAIRTFGLEGIRLIDPTCGSGHFLLGTFDRLLAKWQKEAPGLDAREHVIHTLDAIHGVDLNPFAVAIARFRLLVAALKATGIKTLKEAPGWRFNVTAGDSLLHGRRFDQLDLGADDIRDRYAHAYAAEDIDEINRILGQQYHAVVGNPPYITAPDRALNTLYRQRYPSCHMQFSLGVPFTERFFQLAIQNANRQAGFVGMITTNSFMKREFGRKLIEEYLPHQDLTHVIDTSGAYIPGHGTPTIILFGRNRSPVSGTLRAVLGIRGEPSTPAEPAQGVVWSSIAQQVDQPGSQNDYVSVTDMARERLAQHPWSLQGGSAPEIGYQIEQSAETTLAKQITEIGFICMTRADEVYFTPASALRRAGIADAQIVENVEGDRVRDWDINQPNTTLFPYDESLTPVSEEYSSATIRFLWPHRSALWLRREPNGNHHEIGLTWYEWSRFQRERYRIPLAITFAFVATHNHFVLDRGGKVFNRSAPVIKLPADASEDDHLGLLGLLNSSTACFWMKQVFHNKGSTVDTKGARQTTVEFENFYEFTGTGLKRFPLPDGRPLKLTQQLDQFAQQRAANLPVALSDKLPLSRAELDKNRDTAASLLRQMVALQEELDWWCYRAYGLLDDDLCYAGSPPEVQLGERAFEIVLARRMQADEVQTKWFQRHGSTPITEVPDHWHADYRALVERRIEAIESNAWIGLLEKPEYKRRWNQPDWADLEQAALKSWLLDRLETQTYWPQPELRSITTLAATAERDRDWMQVAELYTGQPGFDIPGLLRKLVEDEAAPALKILRYKAAGLRKRAEWEQTWDKQRREDAIDSEVIRDHPRGDDETEDDWQQRIEPEQNKRKAEEVGDIPAPPKYSKGDFQNNTLWRLRGGLDVPKERFFCVPDPQNPGEWLYGWAGWNPAERVQALAGAYIHAEQTGAELTRLIPLLAALHEQLPWVRQWHNDIDPAMDVRPGEYFTNWLHQQLNQQGWTTQTLADWQPETTRRRRRT